MVLTREKYKELLDEIARLKGLIKPDKPVPPSSCKLSGKLDGDVVHLTAEFEFAITPTRTLVALGCRQGNPTAATLDGRRPLLQWGEAGWLVQVEGSVKTDAGSAGHELKLSLDVPLTHRGSDRALELSLPGAAITLVDFDLPKEVKSVHLRGQLVATEAGANGRRRLDRALGAADMLDLAWLGEPSPVGMQPFLAADERLTVRITETVVATRAELTLRALVGRPDQYRLLVPPLAEVRIHPGEDPQKTHIQAIETPNPNLPLRIVRLKEATADPVLVEVQFSQPRPSMSSPRTVYPIRPVVLEGVARQRGTILVSKAPDLQVRSHPVGEPVVTVSPREVTEEERQRDANTTAAFTYWNVLAPESPGQPAAALLELEVERIRPVIEAHVTHQLTLSRNAADGTLVWALKTQIDVDPRRSAGVDALRIQLPPADRFEAKLDDVQPARIVLGVEAADAATRVVRLALERQSRRFSVILEGTYRSLEPGAQAVSLALPYPLVPRDGGADIKVTLPSGEFQLVRAHPEDAFWDAQLPATPFHRHISRAGRDAPARPRGLGPASACRWIGPPDSSRGVGAAESRPCRVRAMEREPGRQEGCDPLDPRVFRAFA
jgi:hypothetical protein